jgi:hypothetical protein
MGIRIYEFPYVITTRINRSGQLRVLHPSGLFTRVLDAGLLPSLLSGRRGRTTNSPPQLGQSPPSFCSEQEAQNVHSNEQIRARDESGGRSQSQHSQLGRNSSMSTSAGRKHSLLQLRRFQQKANR